MTAKYSNGNQIVNELWAWYRLQLKKNGQETLGKTEWHFDFFENGKKIPQPARLLYRQRKDLEEAFPNPFEAGKGESYYSWYCAEMSSEPAPAG